MLYQDHVVHCSLVKQKVLYNINGFLWREADIWIHVLYNLALTLFVYPHTLSLHQIGRIPKAIFQIYKRVLDAPHTDKPRKNIHTACLVVRPARAGATKRLLSNDGARAFFVVVDVASCVAEARGCGEKGVAICWEAEWVHRSQWMY